MEFINMVPLVAPYVPGCPIPAITLALRAAAIDACERTLLWRDWRTVTTTAGEYQIAYPVDSGEAIHAVFGVTADKVPLEVLTLEQALVKYPELGENVPVESRDRPRSYVQMGLGDMYLLPPPDDEYDVMMTVAMKPNLEATGLPDEVYAELAEAIHHGAIHRLTMMPGQNWSDDAKAMYHGKQASYRMAAQRARANHGNARASMRARPQIFS